MPASVREVFLLLRARDEASRVLRGFSTELTRTSGVASAAAMRARAAALQGEVLERRRLAAAMTAQVAEKQAQALFQAKRIAEARATGVSETRLESMRLVERQYRREAAEINNKIRVMDKETSAIVAEIRNLDRQSSELERGHRQQRQFAQALASTASTLTTVGIGFLAVAGASAYFFINAFNSYKEYQRQVALTKTQVDGFAASLQDISDIGLRVANKVPVAFGQIQPALYDIFSSSSANLKQAELLLNGFAKAAVAGQTDVQTAARGTIYILNGLNIPFENVNHVLDVQFQLVRKGVGTYDEFAKVLGRVIPAANRSQQSFETVAAMLSYMTRNGQSAAMASTAAARALELFTYPKAVAALENFNVKVKDVKGNFLPLIEILKQLRGQLEKMPQSERVKKIVEIFKGSGFNIQARRFLEQVVLGKNELEDFEEHLKAMSNASGAMQQAYGEMADTAASKTQLLSNRWMILKIAMGEAIAPVLLTVVDIIGKLLDKFNSLDPKTKKTITNALLLATAFAAVAGIGLTILGLMAGIAAAVAAAGVEFFILTGILAGVGTAFIGLVTLFTVAYKKSEPFRNMLKHIADEAKDLWEQVELLGQRFKKAWDTNISPALDKLVTVINDKVLPAFEQFREEVWDKAFPKIKEALRIIGDVAENTLKVIGDMIKDYVVPAIQSFTAWWQKNKDEIQPIIDLLIQLGKWMLIIVAILVAAGLIAALTALLGVFLSVMTAIQVFVEWFKIMRANIMLAWEALKGLWGILTNLWKSITDFFSNSGSWLMQAGAKLIDGLIDGIKSKLGKLKDTTLNLIKEGITNFFPLSPAKTGPLSGRGSTFYSGQTITTMLASGMIDQLAAIRSASAQVAGAAGIQTGFSSQGVLAPVVLGGGDTGALVPMRSNNVTVNVYTNEIDPRATATELGWELEGRL